MALYEKFGQAKRAMEQKENAEKARAEENRSYCHRTVADFFKKLEANSEFGECMIAQIEIDKPTHLVRQHIPLSELFPTPLSWQQEWCKNTLLFHDVEKDVGNSSSVFYKCRLKLSLEHDDSLYLTVRPTFLSAIWLKEETTFVRKIMDPYD
jgi:hypothetical protein